MAWLPLAERPPVPISSVFGARQPPLGSLPTPWVWYDSLLLRDWVLSWFYTLFAFDGRFSAIEFAKLVAYDGGGGIFIFGFTGVLGFAARRCSSFGAVN